MVGSAQKCAQGRGLALASVTVDGVASAVARRKSTLLKPLRGPDMPVLKYNGQQFPLQPGPNRLGGGTTADVAIGGARDILAVVDLSADGRATIRKAGTGEVR